MTNKVKITLEGTKEQLSNIFSYSEDRYKVIDGQGKECQLTTLSSYMAHYFDQTLQRDGYQGGWTQVLLNDSGEYVLKMYCENADLSPYEEKIPAMLKVAQIGVDLFVKNVKGDQANCPVEFLLPFGLSIANTKSVQLLHYPPLETLVYQDYLYSPTNRRWENLLAFNVDKPTIFSELETIVDVVPLAAPGDDGKDLAKYTDAFTAYVKEMLKATLTTSNKRTQPVVVYGSAVRSWLIGKDAFGDQIKGDLEVLTLLSLNVMDDGSTTPVLCANHPSQYLYLTDQPASKDKTTVMTQDLIVAGWQAKMADNPQLDPQAVLNDVTSYWNDNKAKIQEIITIQDNEYGYDGLQMEADYNESNKKVSTVA